MGQNTQTSENNNQVEGSVLFRKPEKKNNKKIILLAVIIIAVLGVVLYFSFFSNKEDNNSVLENEKVGEVEIDKELDSDQDGLFDYIEKILGTDPNNSDTDGDSYSDFEEIKNGYNPLNDKKYTEEEWEGVKEKIRNEDEELYEEIFKINNEKTESESDDFVCGNSTVVDVDNNIYNTVKIGDQCWMKENLKVTKKPNGDYIIRSCYNDNENICNTDGGLYDWNTAMNKSNTEDTQGICPDGWHIPKDSEWYILEDGLAVESCNSDRIGWDCNQAGEKLKSGGSSDFDSIFSGLDADGKYFGLGESANFWTSTDAGGDSEAWGRILDSKHPSVFRDKGYYKFGFSVRCLKN